MHSHTTHTPAAFSATGGWSRVGATVTDSCLSLYVGQGSHSTHTLCMAKIFFWGEGAHLSPVTNVRPNIMAANPGLGTVRKFLSSCSQPTHPAISFHLPIPGDPVSSSLRVCSSFPEALPIPYFIVASSKPCYGYVAFRVPWCLFLVSLAGWFEISSLFRCW